MTASILILCGPAELVRQREKEVLGRRRMTSRLAGHDFVVMSDRPEAVRLPDDMGLVFGEVFSRADFRRAKTISPDLAKAVSSSAGAAFVSGFWGDYLAVLADPAGAAHVIRSPFGALSAYQLRVGAVDVISNDVGLLIDLGWLTPRIDWSFVAHFMAYPFRRARRTGFEGLAELPPGSALTWSSGRSDERALWSPWDHVADDGKADHSQALGDLVRRCVRAWADGRDKVLLELSGGLDSSVLAACLWDADVDVRCVNMVSPALDGDERLYARAVAERLGLALEEIALAPGDVDLTMAPSVRRPRPSGHALLGAWDRTLQARAVDLGSDAFVSGGGGDNVFFKTHSSTPAADALRCGKVGVWIRAVQDLALLHDCSLWRAGSMSVQRAFAPAAQAWRSDLRFLAPGVAGTPLEPHPWLDGPSSLPGKVEHLKLLMSAHNYLDAFARLETAPLLTPLLSQPIVELCLSIPSWEWILGGRDRAVTRAAFRHALPPLVADRRTKGNLSGFAGPAYEAARGKLASHLLGGRLDQAGLLEKAALAGLLRETGPPKGSDYFRILQIADVESWARRWS